MPYRGIRAGVGLITATARPIAECYTFGAGVGKIVLYNEKLYGCWPLDVGACRHASSNKRFGSEDS